MKKIKEIYYLEPSEREGHYADEFLYFLEDGTKIYTQSTDVIADEIVPPVQTGVRPPEGEEKSQTKN